MAPDAVNADLSVCAVSVNFDVKDRFLLRKYRLSVKRVRRCVTSVYCRSGPVNVTCLEITQENTIAGTDNLMSNCVESRGILLPPPRVVRIQLDVSG